MHKRTCRAIAGAIALSTVAGLANAQLEMPANASAPTAAELKGYLDGKVFNSRFADGTEVRLEFKSNGYFFVNTSRGLNSSGPWQALDGQLCSQLKGRDRSCNDVRMHDGALYLKRDSGEIVRYNGG